MPPKLLHRPAAAIPKALPKGKAKAKAKAKVRIRAGRPRLPVPAPESPWVKIEGTPDLKWNVSEKILARVWYCGEEGLSHLLVCEDTKDVEGRWLGVQVLGTPIHQLRTWVLTQPQSPPKVYFSQQEVAPERRSNAPGLGYLLEFKKGGDEDQYPWLNNCLEQNRPGEMGGTGDLQRMAGEMGFGMGRPDAFPPAPPPQVPPRSPSGEKSKGKKKKKREPKASGKAKVKKMVDKARRSAVGTPLDPEFKKPIKLKLKKKKRSSSSSGEEGDSSSLSSSEGGIGEEHRLRSLAKKLPGYLARSAAKEAKKVLAESVGEDPASFQVFHRYIRQIVVPRGGPKPIQRELLTLGVVMDQILQGNILHSLDIIAQRMKALELFQQGCDAALALQVELIPRELLGLTGDSEARFAYKEFNGEARLARQIKGLPPAPAKGAWKGGGKDQPWTPKGGKKGGERGLSPGKGGKRAAESSIVVPED